MKTPNKIREKLRPEFVTREEILSLRATLTVHSISPYDIEKELGATMNYYRNRIIGRGVLLQSQYAEVLQAINSILDTRKSKANEILSTIAEPDLPEKREETSQSSGG